MLRELRIDERVCSVSMGRGVVSLGENGGGLGGDREWGRGMRVSVVWVE